MTFAHSRRLFGPVALRGGARRLDRSRRAAPRRRPFRLAASRPPSLLRTPIRAPPSPRWSSRRSPERSLFTIRGAGARRTTARSPCSSMRRRARRSRFASGARRGSCGPKSARPRRGSHVRRFRAPIPKRSWTCARSRRPRDFPGRSRWASSRFQTARADSCSPSAQRSGAASCSPSTRRRTAPTRRPRSRDRLRAAADRIAPSVTLRDVDERVRPERALQ